MPNDRDELERLRKIKRLRELEAKAGVSGSEAIAAPAPSPEPAPAEAAAPRKQGFANRAADAAVLGFGDEAAAGVVAGIAGGAMGAVDAVRQRDLGAIPRAVSREYGKIRETQQQEARALETENPGQAFAADMLGSTIGLAKVGGVIAKTPVGQLAQKLPTSARLAASGAASGGVMAAGAAEDGQKLDAAKQGAIVGAIAGPVLNKVVGGINHLFRKSNIANAPTIEKLKDEARRLYQRAETRGVTVDGKTTAKIADRMRDRMVKEGIRLPTGEFIDDSMTAIKGVDRVLNAFEGKPITPQQAMTIRTAFQNAAGSQNKNEARIGRILLQRYDGFLSRVAPEIREANALWHKASKADLVNAARTAKAEIRTGQATQSGIDNALRTEFRQILRDINNRKLRGFSADEVEAIKRVANGTGMRNMARAVGKLAPNSLAGQIVGAGGLVGASAVGAPGAVIAGGTVMGAGYGGKALANRLAVQHAETAELLIRAGVNKAFVDRLSATQREQVALLMAARLASRDPSQDDQDRPPRTEPTQERSTPER